MIWDKLVLLEWFIRGLVSVNWVFLFGCGFFFPSFVNFQVLYFLCFWAWGFLLGFFVVVLDRGSNYGFSQLQFQNCSLNSVMLIGSSKLYQAST